MSAELEALARARRASLSLAAVKPALDEQFQAIVSITIDRLKRGELDEGAAFRAWCQVESIQDLESSLLAAVAEGQSIESELIE